MEPHIHSLMAALEENHWRFAAHRAIAEKIIKHSICFLKPRFWMPVAVLAGSCPCWEQECQDAVQVCEGI